jgi:folate-binding protein YgfZ
MHTISTISVTGEDALEFLQGQLTNDLNRLENEPKILAAWCNPKGRVIWFGTVRTIESGFALSVPAKMADGMVQRLTMFRFRSKATFQILEDVVTIDPGTLINDGYPFIGPDQSEQFTPHMLNLDLLDAISFDKGCYTGQEIVARTHYKGATKRRAVRFESGGPVSGGDRITLGDREVGEVLNAYGDDLLAVVPVDKIGDELSVGDTKLTYVPLPYLNITPILPTASEKTPTLS